VLPAKIRRLHPSLMLLQNPNELLFRKRPVLAVCTGWGSAVMMCGWWT
jgi:hypothetical protein